MLSEYWVLEKGKSGNLKNHLQINPRVNGIGKEWGTKGFKMNHKEN